MTKMWRRKVGASAPITTTDASCLVVQQRTHGPCVPTSSLLVLWHYDERPPTKTICAFLQGATRNSSGAIFYSPRRKESFLPKYHLIVPKFQLIAPKYYFFLTWRFFISSGEICDLLGKYSHHLLRVSSRSLSNPVYKNKRDVHLP